MASPAEIDQAKEKALRPFERTLDSRLQAERRKEEARRIAERAVSLLRSHLSVAWEWDSYTEREETTRELAVGLRSLIEQKYLAGRIDEEDLQEYVEEWAADCLAEADLDKQVTTGFVRHCAKNVGCGVPRKHK